MSDGKQQLMTKDAVQSLLDAQKASFTSALEELKKQNEKQQESTDRLYEEVLYQNLLTRFGSLLAPSQPGTRPDLYRLASDPLVQDLSRAEVRVLMSHDRRKQYTHPAPPASMTNKDAFGTPFLWVLLAHMPCLEECDLTQMPSHVSSQPLFAECQCGEKHFPALKTMRSGVRSDWSDISLLSFVKKSPSLKKVDVVSTCSISESTLTKIKEHGVDLHFSKRSSVV